jgi:hypothetical protein
MAELVYRQPCEHGHHDPHVTFRALAPWHYPSATSGNAAYESSCPGGSEIVLDPDKLVGFPFRGYDRDSGKVRISVAEFLAALEGEQK